MYIRLISHYWNTGPLTKDHKRLARVCNLSKHKFEKNWQIISRFFSSNSEKYFHKRLEKEIAKGIEISEKRAEAGRKGGLANAQANAKQMPKHPQPHITVPKGTDGDAVETTEQKIWKHGVDLLTRTGQTEAKARSMLGKCVKEIGPEETLTVIREAWNKADPFTWIAACAVKIKLPNDRDELWRIRDAIGLEYEYDDLKACHAEITQRLRAQPELREVAGL